MSGNKILVVAAHPDDEILGCGGTIARLAQEGKKVYIAILGEGITSRYKEREAADQKLVEDLRSRSKDVAKILGAEPPFLFGLPDNRFDTIPLLDIVKTLEDLIYKIKPSTIFTHGGGDLNIDHSIMHRATLTATRPVAGMPIKQVYAYEVPSSTEWAFGQFNKNFNPRVFIDIKATIEKKVEAMEIYESEVRSFPHPRSPQALRVLAKKWGSVIGLEAAEAFELIREIR